MAVDIEKPHSSDRYKTTQTDGELVIYDVEDCNHGKSEQSVQSDCWGAQKR